MDSKKRNRSLIQEKNIQEMNSRMERFRNVIPPLLNLFGKQIIKKIKGAVTHRIDVMLDYASEYSDRHSIETLDEDIDKYVTSELSRVSSKYIDKSHAHYGRLEHIFIQWFKSRTIFFAQLLNKQGENYEELMKERFKTSDEAKKVLEKQIEFFAQVLELIESNSDLLKLPFGIGAGWLMKFFSMEIQRSKQQLSNDLNRIYIKVQGADSSV